MVYFDDELMILLWAIFMGIIAIVFFFMFCLDRRLEKLGTA